MKLEKFQCGQNDIQVVTGLLDSEHYEVVIIYLNKLIEYSLVVLFILLFNINNFTSIIHSNCIVLFLLIL